MHFVTDVALNFNKYHFNSYYPDNPDKAIKGPAVVLSGLTTWTLRNTLTVDRERRNHAMAGTTMS